MLFVFCSSFAQLSAQAIVYACPPCNSSCDELRYDHPGSCSHCGMALINENEIDQPMKIAFFLQPGVEILDFAGPLEVFSYAGFEVFTVTKDGGNIISQGVLNVQPDYSISNAPEADIIAFFGGNGSNSSKDSEVIDWLKRQEVDYYFSVCTGAFFLGEAQILKGQTATTFHSALDELERRFPDTDVRRDVRFVDNGKIITTAGISAGIDGALHLVARIRGFNAARSTAYYMEYDKWVPGEGLLLGSENPYDTLPGRAELSAYEGTFEWTDGQQLGIKFDQREKSLVVILPSGRLPLFYSQKDEFTDVDGDVVRFQSDDTKKVISFTVDGRNQVFKRIK